MTVRYEITPEATERAYWYRWRTRFRYRLGVFVFGLIPATLAFAFLAPAFRDRLPIAVVVAVMVEAASPLIVAALLQQLSRRGDRTLTIDAGGLSTAVANGEWQVGWSKVQEIVTTPEYIFILGRGINSVSIPVSAFADDAERDEFVRRARRYLTATANSKP